MLAKITRPRLHHVYANQRLLHQLAAARESPCIWLSSPPGAGKTTLAASYLDANKTPAIWYQVDRGDRDPSSMFHHLALGLEQPRFKKIRPQLPGGRELELDLFAQSYFRDYFAAFPKQSILILDNWQDAADGEALVKLTAAAIDALPESINLLVISRQPPPADFARHLANRQMAHISWQDLRLRDEEVAGMMQTLPQHTALTPTELNQSVDGWAAGLILLAETGGKNTALPSLADTSKQGVFNYFAQEFFNPFNPKQ